MRKIVVLSIAALLTWACSQSPARRPISYSEGTFLKESIERNKKLVASEEDKIDSIIKSEPQHTYYPSQKGYYYTYLSARNTQDTVRPKKGDIAYYEYELADLDGNIIYTQLELRPQEYFVDRDQTIMMGLRHGIKLMRKNETVKFLFPSHMGYGYHGDKRRIGQNEPLICTVTLNDIKSE